MSQQNVPIRKKIIILFVVAVANALGSGLAAIYFHPLFLALALGIPVICGLLIVSLKCPRCGHPVAKRTRRVFGVDWTYWGGFTFPSRCDNCGQTFLEGNRTSDVITSR